MLKLLIALFSTTLARFGFVILLAACANPDALAEEASWISRLFGPVTVGSGNPATETRAAAGFQAVAVGGSMNVLLRQSGREGLEVSADNNLLPLIETRVSNGTLHIELKRGANYTSRNPVTVTVDFIALKSLSLGGSGSVKLTDVQFSALDVSIGGSGSFAATGRSPKLSISIGGSGGALTEQLDADDVSVSVAGSGGAVVKANRTLDASVAGSGDVVYSGDAVAKTSKAGSGTVTKR